MILLSKKNGNTYFDFDKILVDGYTIKEDKDRITQKFVNGNRKQILSTYTDVVITINLGTLDLATTKEYIDNLTNGTYKYYSMKNNQYNETNFIVEEIPEINFNSAVDNNAIINDFEITLYRAGD